jgi:hypothetical protein
MSDKAKENRLRRQAQRLGLIIKKSMARNIGINNLMGWMIIDGQTNSVVAGSRFELNLEDVENYLKNCEDALKQ